MATKDPNRLFDLLDALRTNLESVLEDAKTLATEAGSFNGELNKVIKEQITKYFVPAIEKLINDDQTPGSVIGLEKFLGSVPLAMVREQPSEEDVPGNIMPENVNLANPVGTTGNEAIDNIPQNASFRNPEGTAVRESQETTFDGGAWKTEGESQDPVDVAEVKYAGKDAIPEAENLTEKYQVVRTSKFKASGSKEFKEQCIAEFDNKDAADAKACALNETVSPEEKDLFGTEYKVIENKPMTEATEAKAGRSMKDVLDAWILENEKEPL